MNYIYSVQMTNIERILQYTELEQEKEEGDTPPGDWPSKAELQMRDVSLRYSPDAAWALSDVIVNIRHGEKVSQCFVLQIGVVGKSVFCVTDRSCG